MSIEKELRREGFIEQLKNETFDGLEEIHRSNESTTVNTINCLKMFEN
jgi:hypothetical protein